MELREINYVLAIAKHQSITRAAESLYLSQPTLSKFLIGLEQELGDKARRFEDVLSYAVFPRETEKYLEKHSPQAEKVREIVVDWVRD